jgi:hypothetical protein
MYPLPITTSRKSCIRRKAAEPGTKSPVPAAAVAALSRRRGSKSARADRWNAFASKENYGTTLDMLFVRSRVCVCGRPQICGEVARPAASTLETRVGNPNRRHYRVSRSGRRVGRKLTGRVIVRLDPPHPAWRGTLRSFRPERLVICS